MSIYARVNMVFNRQLAERADDYDLDSILDGLSGDELRTWVLECKLDEELRPQYGMLPDFNDIVEREIYARGIEKRDAA